jgi:serine O-acetyltransferase
MTEDQYSLADVVALLTESGDSGSASHRYSEDSPMPSVDVLSKIVEDLRCVLFPGYFGPSDITPDTMPYYLGATLDQLTRSLADQINRGYCFVCDSTRRERCKDCESRAKRTAEALIARLPKIRELLLTDVEAAYDGDPAAKTHGETIFCYPSIRALTNHRIAHELYLLDVDIIPRIIGEMAHSDTGIDIHPGATIGKSFFIDHGTGTVIGETAIIGNNVRIYQGVTLGAKSFPKGEDERLIKGLPRHPIVEDDVIIYAGATILGRVTIGKKAVIGGNIWITRDVPAGSQIVQSRAVQQSFEHGGGI